MAYHVYVIELDSEVRRSGRFQKANPRMTIALPCLYVGQTAKSPAARFRQHLSGGRLSNSFVKRYGRRLLPDLYRKYNPIPTRKDALELEKYLAEILRAAGHGVWTN
ncbi:MAG: GIY-YIG nuclease family protein [Candidatus Erginobacter occultus]|nr:GIY-YIG nuclease family protein [Candidatus Erginobacter occultus]